MCIAHIDHDGKWILKAALFHKDSPPNAPDFWFDFLIDTGAETTVLSRTAAIGIGVDFDSRPKSDKKIFGVNGQWIETWILDYAKLVLMCNSDEPGNFHLETCENMLIADTLVDGYWGYIGRDILNRFNITSDIENNKIRLTRITTILPDLFKVI